MPFLQYVFGITEDELDVDAWVHFGTVCTFGYCTSVVCLELSILIPLVLFFLCKVALLFGIGVWVFPYEFCDCFSSYVKNVTGILMGITLTL